MNTEVIKENIFVRGTLYFYSNQEAEERNKILTSRRIKALVALNGINIAEWAREMGVTRGAFYNVIDGRDKSSRIRQFIEERLEHTFWG